MIDDDKGWLGSRYARLSTGLKMLLVLSLGLLPLGLIAILASIESARDNSRQRVEDLNARVEIKAQRIDNVLSRSVATIRAASAALAVSPNQSLVCTTSLERLARTEGSQGQFALFAGGEPRCMTTGFALPASLPVYAGEGAQVEITPGGGALRFVLFGEDGRIEGIGEFQREELARVAQLPGTASNYDLVLADDDSRMVLRDGFQDGALVRAIDSSEPVIGGRYTLAITTGAIPISAPEALMILLPVMMWIGAAVIGWMIVDRLLLRPLVRMQRAVAAYRPGDRQLDLPTLQTPAREIEDLGNAFNQVTQTVARHEADLEAAVERQTRLVREVHHRVKNNLQVVASLLNLHARGATSDDVAAAYASIQRRVDALAVVHRNHYAELEENRGVSLRSLISELGANLRGTAPASAAGMQIRLDIEPYYVTQDVAVSVAFLITEIVEFAMFCGGRTVTITLSGDNGSAALLAIESDSLKRDVPCDENLADRFERIVTGLSRQLRSVPQRDEETGRYALDIAVVDKAER